MQLGTVIGSATATIKHDSMVGCRLLVVQPLNINRKAEGDPIVVVDKLGAGEGQTVVLNADGKFAREYVNHPKSPVRWTVIGIENA